jgi:hypothetical protein
MAEAVLDGIGATELLALGLGLLVRVAIVRVNPLQPLLPLTGRGFRERLCKRQEFRTIQVIPLRRLAIRLGEFMAAKIETGVLRKYLAQFFATHLQLPARSVQLADRSAETLGLCRNRRQRGGEGANVGSQAFRRELRFYETALWRAFSHL